MQTLGLISLVVKDYDEALAFYVGKLGFTLIEDSFVPEQNKRWVVIEPPGAAGAGAKLLLARGSNDEQVSRVGNQTGGRGFAFPFTEAFLGGFQAQQRARRAGLAALLQLGNLGITARLVISLISVAVLAATANLVVENGVTIVRQATQGTEVVQPRAVASESPAVQPPLAPSRDPSRLAL